jgi:ABC-type uncharacterized transport system involved in gliding motility auxiliary subunit
MKTPRPNVPILIMSDVRRLPEEGLELVDDFLLKGGSISVFLERVRALLDATVARRMYPRFRAARIA